MNFDDQKPALVPLKASTYFSLISFLESEGIEPSLIESIKSFIVDKYAMSLLQTSKNLAPVSCNDMMFQWRFFNKQNLENVLLEHNSLKERENLTLCPMQEARQTFTEKKKPWFNPFQSKRNRMMGKAKTDRFPKEIFIHHFQKLKSIFGHKSMDEDYDDYAFMTSPVYNLLFDKTGKIIVTADDDGVIKVWSAETGILLVTLKSHKSIINSIDISPCNKYLASCSNDGSIRVWSFLEKKPLAVLRENINEKLLILFFYAFEPITHGMCQKLILTCASEEGNIYLYDSEDFIQNNGIYLPGQRVIKLESNYMQLYDFPSSKGICSIDFHPQGFLAVGTQVGDIVIFDSIKKLKQFGGNDHSLKSWIWAEHKKTCHLSVWSKDGSKLISASFDGTAKLWLIPNPPIIYASSNDHFKNKNQADYTIYFDESKSHDAKCWAVNWSHNSRYAMATFSRKSRKKTEAGKLLSNIQIYDTWKKAIIQKIDSTTVPIEMNQFIFIIEPHPFKENIAFSADYEGKIVLWDIELGLILNVFFEKGDFINYSSLELPCLDGRFSPDGYSFAVSTYYGTFSIYGYGLRDPYDYTPIEQFLRNDHRRFGFDELLRIVDYENGLEESVPNEPLCNALRSEYPFQPHNSLDALYKNGYFFKQENNYTLESWLNESNESEQNNKLIIKDYENLLFFEKQNENQRVLLAKPNEEINALISSILQKQKKQIISSYKSLQSNSVKKEQNQQKAQLSTIQAKKIKKIREIAGNSDHNNNDSAQENLMDLEENSSQRQAFRRLSRGSTQRRLENPPLLDSNNYRKDDDFDDPEDENWELDSEISLKIKPTKINTRTRASNQQSNNRKIENTSNEISKNGPQTRALRKKVMVSEEEEFKQKKEIMDSDEEEYKNSDSDEKKGYSTRNRNGLRKKKLKKDYFDDEEDYNESGSEFNENDDMDESFQYKHKKSSNNNQKNHSKLAKPLKKRERPNIDDFDSINESKSNNPFKKIKLNSFEISNENAYPRNYSTRTLQNKDEINPSIFLPAKFSKCSRCFLENPNRKCSSSLCERVFHEYCSQLRGLIKDENHFFCYDCWLIRKKSSGIVNPYDTLIEFSRTWLDHNEQIQRYYVPQIADKVYYFFQGHEEFIKEYWEVLAYPQPTNDCLGEIFPFVRYETLLQPSLCEVVGIEYAFPQIRNKKITKKFENPNIFMNLRLKELQNNFEFAVQYCQSDNLSSYLVLKDVFEFAKKFSESLANNKNITYLKNFQEISGQIIELSPKETGFENSFWKSVKIVGIDEDGYNLRNHVKRNVKNEVFSDNKSVERINAWEILSYSSTQGAGKKIEDSLFKQNLSSERTKEILMFLDEYIQNNEEITENFVDNVDLKSFPDYPFIIPFELNLKKIILRLEKKFYRNEEALKHDLQTIKNNAFIFNDPKKALVCNHVTQIIEEVIEWLEGKIYSPPKGQNNFYSNSSGKSKKIEKKNKMITSEELKENIFEIHDKTEIPNKDVKNDLNNGRMTRSKAIFNKN